jgi:hypothetical protein
MLQGLPQDDKSIGSEYNIEYRWGNGSRGTISGELENVDSENFWFRSEGQIVKINQDHVIIMVPLYKRRY